MGQICGAHQPAQAVVLEKRAEAAVADPCNDSDPPSHYSTDCLHLGRSAELVNKKHIGLLAADHIKDLGECIQQMEAQHVSRWRGMLIEKIEEEGEGRAGMEKGGSRKANSSRVMGCKRRRGRKVIKEVEEGH